jgi:hypothetical protein
MNVGHVIKNCFSGFYALLRDPAGIMCLLVLGIVSFLCLKGKVGDVAFSACCTLIPAVIAMLKHKSFSGSDIDQCPPAPPVPDPSVVPAPVVVAPSVDPTVAPDPSTTTTVTTTTTIPLVGLPARGQL